MRPYRRRQGVIKALRVLKAWSDSEHDYVDEFFHEDDSWTKRMVNTRCPCSCSSCGNPRNCKWFSHDEQVTLQERRSDISFKEQVEDALIIDEES